MIKDRKLLWSGEHWILYLRRPGEASNSASVGVYYTRFSEAGEGSVALVSVPGNPALSVAVTDNVELYKFTMDRVRVGAADDPFNDLDLPVLDGTLARGGDVRNDPYWTLDAGDVSSVVRWSGPPVPR